MRQAVGSTASDAAASPGALCVAGTQRVAGALALTVLAGAVIPAAAAMPRAHRPIAILSARAADPALVDAIGVAGGTVVSTLGGRVTIAMPGPGGLAAALRRQGYWLILDAGALAACAPSLAVLGGHRVQDP